METVHSISFATDLELVLIYAVTKTFVLRDLRVIFVVKGRHNRRYGSRNNSCYILLYTVFRVL